MLLVVTAGNAAMQKVGTLSSQSPKHEQLKAAHVITSQSQGHVSGLHPAAPNKDSTRVHNVYHT